ncbi:MAG TPA: PQQ-binding-like beta-propeller repeat protein [Planctomycetota bacterium]|nr:PQQ-binding-like beta-propeller repeat protein [Planctomycetota bacterium]
MVGGPVAPRSRTLCLLGALASLTLAVGLHAGTSAEWPCFHGPRRDNKSTETGLLKQWPEEGPALLWSASGLGKGYSSASVAGGLLYTAGMVEQQTGVVALGLDGKEKWRAPNGQAWAPTMSHATGYGGARSTPTWDDGVVYHLSERGRLIALEAQSGKEVWHLDLLKEFEGEMPKYGFAESVLILGDRLICCPGGAKGYMACLDKKTGKTVWTNTEVQGTLGYCSPVLADIAGTRQVLNMSAKVVFGVDIVTGKLLWSVEHGNERENSATDPVVHEGHVYASAGYGKGSILVRLDPVQGGVEAKTVWRSKLLDNHHGGVLLVGEHLYGAGHQAEGWFCLDFLTGRQAWKASGKGSLTYADGMLYCLDERGTMTLVEATPKEHRAVSSFRLPKGGAGLYWAHPVVCGGRLYVRHADALFAYDIRAR